MAGQDHNFFDGSSILDSNGALLNTNQEKVHVFLNMLSGTMSPEKYHDATIESSSHLSRQKPSIISMQLSHYTKSSGAYRRPGRAILSAPMRKNQMLNNVSIENRASFCHLFNVLFKILMYRSNGDRV